MLLKLMFIYLCAAFLLITFMVGEYTLLILPPLLPSGYPNVKNVVQIVGRNYGHLPTKCLSNIILKRSVGIAGT